MALSNYKRSVAFPKRVLINIHLQLQPEKKNLTECNESRGNESNGNVSRGNESRGNESFITSKF